jgi:hypothetical protein
VIVSALPPDRIATDVNERSQLNLFLYQVTPNPGWRNEGLPSRSGSGDRLTNPPLALDLHYLLSAYGARDLHPEILLGVGMQILHETPALPRDAIRRALAEPTPVSSGGGLPADLQQLFTSGLADQVEQIKIAPYSISTEEISRLWTAFQARYRPTAAYQVTVVLIESRRTTRSSLPVLRRQFVVAPFRQPVIERILSRSGPGALVLDQPILAGYDLVLRGRNLSADDTLVRIGGIEQTPESLTDSEAIAAIPAPLEAGIHGVQVVHRTGFGSPPVPHLGVSSNVAPFVLRPRIVSTLVTNVSGSGTVRSADISVTIVPPAGSGQSLVLLLNQVGTGISYSFQASPFAITSPPILSPPFSTDQITFSATGVAPGNYLTRVQVDGAESPLSATSGQYDAPVIQIP